MTDIIIPIKNININDIQIEYFNYYQELLNINNKYWVFETDFIKLYNFDFESFYVRGNHSINERCTIKIPLYHQQKSCKELLSFIQNIKNFL